MLLFLSSSFFSFPAALLVWCLPRMACQPLLRLAQRARHAPAALAAQGSRAVLPPVPALAQGAHVDWLVVPGQCLSQCMVQGSVEFGTASLVLARAAGKKQPPPAEQ